jgi:hypothetical protein
MGHRATYVLIERGAPAYYRSQFGAWDLPAQLLGGPEATEALIRDRDPAEGLLDYVWAEGGILLDMVERCVLFFGGAGVAYAPDKRRILLRVLSLAWQGWSVQWAACWVVDFARYLKLDLSLVLTDPLEERLSYWQEDPDRCVTSEATTEPKHLITVKYADGRITDCRVVHHAIKLLLQGPALLDQLTGEPAPVLPHERDDLRSGAYLDLQTTTIWLWEPGELDLGVLQEIGRRWVGWQVDGHVEGLPRHVLLSGRDPTDIMIPEQESARALTETLIGYREYVDAPYIEAALRNLPLLLEQAGIDI